MIKAYSRTEMMRHEGTDKRLIWGQYVGQVKGREGRETDNWSKMN